MKIRPGKISDIPAIIEIVAEVVRDMNAVGNFQWSANYPTPEVFAEDIKNASLFTGTLNAKVTTFIVLDENQPPGYNPIRWRKDARALVLHRFAVDSAARGQGIAGIMETFACELARTKGLNTIRTDTNSANTVMQ